MCADPGGELGVQSRVWEPDRLVSHPSLCDPGTLASQVCTCECDDGGTKVAVTHRSHDGECGRVPMTTGTSQVGVPNKRKKEWFMVEW